MTPAEMPMTKMGFSSHPQAVAGTCSGLRDGSTTRRPDSTTTAPDTTIPPSAALSLKIRLALLAVAQISMPTLATILSTSLTQLDCKVAVAISKANVVTATMSPSTTLAVRRTAMYQAAVT